MLLFKLHLLWVLSDSEWGSNYFSLTPHSDVHIHVNIHGIQIFASSILEDMCMRHCFGNLWQSTQVAYILNFSRFVLRRHCFYQCECTHCTHAFIVWTCPHIYDDTRQWNSTELNCSMRYLFKEERNKKKKDRPQKQNKTKQMNLVFFFHAVYAIWSL